MDIFVHCAGRAHGIRPVCIWLGRFFPPGSTGTGCGLLLLKAGALQLVAWPLAVRMMISNLVASLLQELFNDFVT